MHPLAKLDHEYVWHPFTQMRDWLKTEPVVIAKGRGAVLQDVRGRKYLDANSSIWTNLHGHSHPKINAAIRARGESIPNGVEPIERIVVADCVGLIGGEIQSNMDLIGHRSSLLSNASVQLRTLIKDASAASNQ